MSEPTIMTWRCRWGFHKWGTWIDQTLKVNNASDYHIWKIGIGTNTPACIEVDGQLRKCASCGQRDTRHV